MALLHAQECQFHRQRIGDRSALTSINSNGRAALLLLLLMAVKAGRRRATNFVANPACHVMEMAMSYKTILVHCNDRRRIEALVANG
jgi:hypothetical protein